MVFAVPFGSGTKSIRIISRWKFCSLKNTASIASWDVVDKSVVSSMIRENLFHLSLVTHSWIE